MECDAPRDAIAVSWYQGSRILGTFKLSSQKGKNIDGLTPYDLNWEVDSEDLIRNDFKVFPKRKSVNYFLDENFETYQVMTRRWNLTDLEVILQEAIAEERDQMDIARKDQHINPIPIVYRTLTSIGDGLIYQMVEAEEVFQKLKRN